MRLHCDVILAIVLGLSASAARAELLDVTLDPASLPSTQGFTYSSVLWNGEPGPGESGVFSSGSGFLSMSTLGSMPGTSFYRRAVSISRDYPVQLRVIARCVEHDPPADEGHVGAFGFLFANGQREYGFAISPEALGVAQGGGWRLSEPVYDNTDFHEYLFDWSPGGVWQLYRDGLVVLAGASATLVTQSHVRFGDLDIGSSARGDIAMLRLTQDRPTPAPATTWGRIKGLYR